MLLYRLCRELYAIPLSGKGSALKGGRWNSPGIELVYTASNRSLAMAEVAVHMTMAMLPDDYVMMTLEVPDDISFQQLSLEELPSGWKDFPHQTSTQRFGDDFVLSGKYCLLQVPSAVTQGDFNYLINPKHSDFGKVRVVNTEPFPFDRRIIAH